MVSIIDYNMGNLASIKNAFEKIDYPVAIIKTPDEIKKADRLILPGVGAYPDAMEHLKQEGLGEAIKEFAKSGKPLLGICLGMQLLFDKSYEFKETEGLGIVEGKVEKFCTDKMNKKEKIPHMGWNSIDFRDSLLFEGVGDEPYLYFVHSYHVVCDDRFSIGKTYYGYEFTSAINKDNIYGLQPHPEKSHDVGLKILKNFTRI